MNDQERRTRAETAAFGLTLGVAIIGVLVFIIALGKAMFGPLPG